MSEILGVGCDLCEIARMERLLRERRFLQKCFCDEEIAYVEARGAMGASSLAGMWAAKEAAVKALGIGISVPLTEICVRHLPSGQPEYLLSGSALACVAPGRLSLSISHEAGMALAFCVWSGSGSPADGS